MELKTTGLGTGIYTYSEAAKILCMSSQTINYWILGRNKDNSSAVLPLPELRDKTITFYDLIELYFVKSLRRAGVKLPVIRRVSKRLSVLFNTPYPFAHVNLYTDGHQILLHDKDIQKYINAENRQIVFNYIDAFLKNLDFENNLAKAYWPLGKDKDVVLNPSYGFGAPVVVRDGHPSKLRTEIIYNLYIAEKRNVEAVAKWYEIPKHAVVSAVEFEETCQKAA